VEYGPEDKYEFITHIGETEIWYDPQTDETLVKFELKGFGYRHALPNELILNEKAVCRLKEARSKRGKRGV
jgi:hypothetical protein